MLRVVVIALLAVAASGCITQTSPTKPTLISTHVTVESAARMLAAEGIAEKWKTAENICNEAGLATGSEPFLLCFKAHQTHALHATRARAKALTDDVARRHGLCIDRKRFEISRCMEI